MTESNGAGAKDTTGLEKTLAESELRLRQAIDAMPHMIWLAALDGNCIFLSQRWEEYTGIAATEQLGHNWAAQLHEQDRPQVRAIWANAVATGAEFQLHCRIRRFDGTHRWFETRGMPIRDPQGHIVRWFGTNTDVHDTYEARRQLAVNEERLRYVALATHDAIYDWDLRNGMTYRNDRFQELFAAPPELKTSDRWWKDHIHPDDYQRIVASVNAAFAAHIATWSADYRLLRSDGTYAVVTDRTYVLYDTDRKPLRLIGAIADETARRETEQSLRDAQARLKSAMQAAGLATWIWDVANDEVIWDEDAFRLWGRTPGEFDKLSFQATMEMTHPDDWAAITATGAESRRTGVDTPMEFRVVWPDNTTRWILSKGEIERDDQGKPKRMVGVYLDITERKRSEEARLNSQKMEALGTLAGGIAHDFNNILLAIAGNTRLALQDLTAGVVDVDSLSQSLREIDKASTRAADLVKRILTFSRHQDAKREAVALRPLIDEALRLLRHTLSTQIKIHTAHDGNVLVAAVDATQLHQVIMNLVTNAAYAIGNRSGVITIQLSQRQLDAEAAYDLDDIAPGGYACIDVSDTGGGIDPAIIGRIFDPFFTTKKLGEGTGLGLAVVHGIVKAQGGAVTVTSEPDRGARFCVYLPLALSAVGTGPIPASVPLAGTGEHVLYVDDEESLVFLVTRVLERLGYRVTGCVDPEQALRELRARPHEFDVVVTDLSMRGMNGFELTRAVKTIRSDLPVLLTSGYLRNEDRDLAAQLGIRELILKPNTVEELGQAIDRTVANLR